MEMKKIIIGIAVLILVTGIYLSVNSVKTTKAISCGNDETCFKTAATVCNPASYTINQKNEITKFEIRGGNNKNCAVDVTLVGSDRFPDLIGKSVKCMISSSELAATGFAAISPLSENCSGEMKDALLKKLG